MRENWPENLSASVSNSEVNQLLHKLGLEKYISVFEVALFYHIIEVASWYWIHIDVLLVQIPLHHKLAASFHLILKLFCFFGGGMFTCVAKAIIFKQHFEQNEFFFIMKKKSLTLINF